MMQPTTMRRWRRVSIAALGVLATVAVTSSLQAHQASAVTTTLITGNGGGATDTVWNLTAAPATVTTGPATIVTAVPVAWTAAITGTSWISSNATPGVTDLAGDYVYEAPTADFTVPTSLAGSIAADASVKVDLVQGTTVTNVGTFTGAAAVSPVTFTGQLFGTYTVRLTVSHATAGTSGVSASFTFTDMPEPPATQYHALATPIRVYDSRTGTGAAANSDGPLSFGTTRTISLASGYATPSATTKVNAVLAGATSATLNVTIDGTVGKGFLTVFAANVAQPATSSVNWFGDDQILANMNVVSLAPDGTIKVTAGGPGSAQVIIDVLGYSR